ncbi:MAG TPA: tetratricopeptide repeat protein [Candidatus Angelobacter sp.]|nr:tetratricopeptide repeat protein [Candidatus Angelobacter sp.]
MQTSARKSKKPPGIPRKLLQDLKHNLAMREVSSGIALLETHENLFEFIDPVQPNAAALIGCVAQWVDIGYGEPGLIEKLLTRIPKEKRGGLPLSDYLQLRMAEGLLALLRDHPDEALSHFDVVLSMQEEIEDKEMVAIAHFWNARCHRKKGEYDEALKRAGVGRELAQTLGFPRMAAVMRVLESWLLFQKGQYREAARILDQAEAALRNSDDHITLGNIYSAHGRMVRRQGHYQEALKYFSRAIEHFQRRNPQHRNLARTLTNIAYVQRLVAVQMGKQIDAQRERSQGPKSPAVRGQKHSQLRQHEELRTSAFANLDLAEKIYRHHEHHHGIGSVLENRGLLFLDVGDLDNAGTQAAQAYELGKEVNDSILMARSRLLQCEVENGKLEEEIEGSTHSWEHAQAARDYSREAVEAAKHTQNHRLLARAYIWRGLTSCHPSIHDIEDAKRCCELASSFLKAVDYDDLWEELQMLKQKVMPKGSIDPLLRAWSQGITGEETFQELTEQFAEIVIPKVWEKEDKKVSRVAKRLSVSPKKVRRILARAGKRKK